MQMRCAVAAACLLAAGVAAGTEGLRLTSPDGAVQAELAVDGEGRLVYEVGFRGKVVVDRSPIGITLDGEDLGKAAELSLLRVREERARYPLRGGRAEARLEARRALYYVKSASGVSYGVQAVAANEGFAWRILVTGEGRRRVNAETACWRLPPESRVWFAERRSEWKLKTYAGEWISAGLSELHAVSPQGPVQTMPLVAELPQGTGYAVVTEAGLLGYSGMRLAAEADGTLRGNFTEAEGFEIEGLVQTPWRVVMLAGSLDALVNNDLVSHLAAPPDPDLFGEDTAWTEGGRSVWSWWQGEEDYMSVEGERRVIDCAAELGFEFTTIDEGWEQWTNAWQVLKEVCDYGRGKGVRAFVWKHAKELNLPEGDFAALREFLDRVRDAGAAGVKVDFMNSESLATIVFDERVLREAAARRLLVNFHGCQKPSGEARTYPNEVTREGVRGMELNRITENYLKRQQAKGADLSGRAYVPGGENQDIPASHNAALPFTRCVVGHADYTPIAFSRPGGTTWAHQLAMAYLVTSPLLVMAEHPRRLLDDPAMAPAVPFVRELPVTWDETRVLEGSKIGDLAAFARRKGDVWYVAMVNGTEGLKLVSFGTLFTGWPQVRVTRLADVKDRPAAFAPSSKVLKGGESVIVTLEPRGGFVAKLERE